MFSFDFQLSSMGQNAKNHQQFPFGTASKTIKRKAVWFGIFWLFGGTALMIFISPFLLNRCFAEFNQAHINAPIENINVTDHGLAVQIQIKGDSYAFYPTTVTGESNALRLVKVAQVGDSIRK